MLSEFEIQSTGKAIFSVAIALAITGCIQKGYFYDHMKPGNYLDVKQVGFFQFNDDPATIFQQRILSRFPVGTSAEKIIQNLKKMGAVCQAVGSSENGCNYTQYVSWGKQEFGIRTTQQTLEYQISIEMKTKSGVLTGVDVKVLD
ncbi:MAG: hypothetical protein QF393_20630, partial [Rhodospirillales bacterium]|nr:hypothetical protein [Rhodospirillales bacterium]